VVHVSYPTPHTAHTDTRRTHLLTNCDAVERADDFCPHGSKHSTHVVDNPILNARQPLARHDPRRSRLRCLDTGFFKDAW
jgi:hypothetical protein